MMNMSNVKAIDFVGFMSDVLESDGFTLVSINTPSNDNLVILTVVSSNNIKACVPCIFDSLNVLDMIDTIRQSIVNYYSAIAINVLTNSLCVAEM